MTIQNTTLRKAGPSQGNGVTTVFPFTFKVFTATDILVTYLSASGVESALFLTTNYTVLLNADQNTSPGGTVTLLVAPATATYITLTSQLANTQTLSLTNSGGFYPESINNALDRTVIEIQQLAERASRAVTIPKSSTTSTLLPIPVANNVLAWNNTATALINLPTTVSLPIDITSVKNFGAVGDGTTDDTVAIQAAINYTGSKLGGTILLPAGSYKITSTLSCLYPNILFVGDGSDEPHNIGSQGAAAATKLVWAGASGGTMLNIASVDGVNNIKYSGGGVRSIYFDSGCTTNGTGASYGIDLVSFNEGVFENVMFREFQDYGIRVGCITQLWDARDPQHNRFINCWSRNYVNKTGGLFLLEGDTAMFSGTGNGGTHTLANVSLNHFENCGAQFLDGIAFNIKNSDHNFFINCRANRINPTGTGQGIVLQGSNQRNTGALLGTLTSDLAFVARKNVFFGFSGGNQIVAKGKTITATVTMTIATPAVVTWTAHGLAANTAVTFSTTGTLPTGLTAGTTYYVLAPTTNTFTVSATVGGAAIPTSGTQSGVHSCAVTVTMTIAAPAVVTWTAHGFVTDSAISFTTTGALPTGLTAGTTYYVLAPTTDTFNVSATVGGVAITTSGTQSGVHSCTTPSYLYPSYKNIFTMMDDSNNTPFPTIETAALCYVTMRTDGVGYYPNQVSGVFSYAASIDNASAMALQARSRVGSESLRLENRSSNGLRIARPNATNSLIEGEWSLAVIEAAGFAGENLAFSRITGTGCIEVGSSIAQYRITITDATTTLTNINAVVLVDATSGNCVINLPLAASYGTSVSPAIKIRRIDSTSANTVTVQRQSTNTLNGGTAGETLTTGTGKTYICNGTAGWYSL